MAMGLSIVGGVISALGAQAQAKASEKAEKARQRMMNLEAMRKRRELIREGVVARAQAVSSATAQGAAEGTALQGGIAQIAGQTNRNLVANREDRALGNTVFKANRAYAKAGEMIALGGAIGSIGSALG